MTKGELRVGVDFNPSNNDDVAFIKTSVASLIDYIESMPKSEDPAIANEQSRLKAIAQTELETAAMYAVKAATKGS